LLEPLRVYGGFSSRVQLEQVDWNVRNSQKSLFAGGLKGTKFLKSPGCPHVVVVRAHHFKAANASSQTQANAA
jgi:hypothetical protein